MKVNCITKMYLNSLAKVKTQKHRKFFSAQHFVRIRMLQRLQQKTYKLKSDISEFICDRPGLNK